MKDNDELCVLNQYYTLYRTMQAIIIIYIVSIMNRVHDSTVLTYVYTNIKVFHTLQYCRYDTL